MPTKTTFHELKTWPEFFEPVWTGEKTFELRKDDRGFRAGDTLKLREFIPKHGEYTGRVITALVTYILGGMGLEKDYVAMSTLVLHKEPDRTNKEG